MTSWSGQRVIVVGAASGIGLACARAFAERGAEAILVGRNEERLADAARTLGAAARATIRAADATREEDVRALFERAGAFDHLVVTAADLRYAPVAELSPELAHGIFDSKLLAAALLAKHGARAVRRGGSMTFTTGIAAARPMARGALVAAVNGGVEAFVRALALELAPIRVNALSPGWIDTPIWSRVAGDRKDEVLGAMAERLPVGRVGRPEDVAHAAVFLAENGFTTGSVLHVDGGHRLV